MKLRAHQRAAVAAVLTKLTQGPRATLVSATGTGKTLMSAAAARSIARDGRILVVVPTLDLLGQTITAWDAYGQAPARYLAVCSDEELTRTRHGTRACAVTTSPAELASEARGPGVTYATYASLPVIVAAHRDHRLPPWDLAVIDEAHRTSGKLGRPWTAIHADAAIPAARRLYMTATPRIVDETGAVVASMDDEAIYGPVAWRLGLGDAIRAGILADYRVAVPAVDGRQAGALIRSAEILAAEGGPAVPADAIGLAAALLRTAADLGLRQVISYHSRVARARMFARAVSAADLALPEGEKPERVWARATWAKVPATARRDLLREFARGDGLRLLANARLLGEGVDAPATDAVVFADPKYSVIDTVQAIGRALRPGDIAGKVATIVIPVFVAAADNPESALDSSAWAPLWKTLRALHAHDDRVAARIRDTGPGDSSGGGGAPDLSWLHLSGMPVPADFPLAVQLRLLDRKSAEWRRGYAAARRYHGAYGKLDAPQSYVDSHGVALGSWLSWQRYLHNSQNLAQARREALEALGITWSPRVSAWQRGYGAARRCLAEHGHLAIPRGTISGGFDVGTWLDNQRHRSSLAAGDRRRLLTELDPYWNARWGALWQRSYYDLRDYHAAKGHADVPRTYRTPAGRHLGEWVHAQRQDPGSLAADQRELLDALSFNWQADSPHERNWERGYAAAVRYHAAHGNLTVPQKYVEAEGVRLGIWINNIRRRKERLPAWKVALLDALGMSWGMKRHTKPA